MVTFWGSGVGTATCEFCRREEGGWHGSAHTVTMTGIRWKIRAGTTTGAGRIVRGSLIPQAGAKARCGSSLPPVKAKGVHRSERIQHPRMGDSKYYHWENSSPSIIFYLSNFQRMLHLLLRFISIAVNFKFAHFMMYSLVSNVFHVEVNSENCQLQGWPPPTSGTRSRISFHGSQPHKLT